MAKKKVEKNNTINIKSQPVQAHIGADLLMMTGEQ